MSSIAIAGGGSGGRTILKAAQSYYVSTTGSDSNDGLTPAKAWATVVHAMIFIGNSIDIGGQNITVNISAGTFAGLGLRPTVGAGAIYFLGAGHTLTTLQDAVIDGVFNTGGETISWYNPSETVIDFSNMKIQNINAYTVISMFTPVNLTFGFYPPAVGNSSVDFSIVANQNLGYISYGNVYLSNTGFFTMNWTANPAIAWFVFDTAFLAAPTGTGITVTGSPNFGTTGYLNMIACGVFDGTPATPYSGASSGYQVNLSSGSDGVGGTLPGNSLGAIDASSSYNGNPATLVANLPVATPTGQHRAVTDSTATLAAGLGNIVAGLGGNYTPVYSDGTNWRIG